MFADELVSLVEEETALEGVIGRLVETGRYCGMERNAGNTRQ